MSDSAIITVAKDNTKRNLSVHWAEEPRLRSYFETECELTMKYRK